MTITRYLILAATSGICCMALAAGAMAAGPALIETGKDWDAFRLAEGKSRTCYMRSAPVSSEPAGARRGEISLFITHRTGDKTRNEVSVLAGYTYKPASPVTITIGKSKFKLFTDGDTAWVETPKDEAALIGAMRIGSQLTISGTSSRGTKTTDRYSLSGFSGALKAINKACGIK